MREILERAANACLISLSKNRFDGYCFACDNPESMAGDKDDFMEILIKSLNDEFPGFKFMDDERGKIIVLEL